MRVLSFHAIRSPPVVLRTAETMKKWSLRVARGRPEATEIQKYVCCAVIHRSAIWSDSPKYSSQFHPLGIVETIFYRFSVDDTCARNQQVLSSVL
jgi:hypothetical protein